MPQHLLPTALLALTLPFATLAQESIQEVFDELEAAPIATHKPVNFGDPDFEVPADAKRFERIELQERTVGELLDFLQTEDPYFQPMLTTPDRREVKLPTLSLKNMRSYDLMHLLNGERIGDGDYIFWVRPTWAGGQPFYKIQVLPDPERPAEQVMTFVLDRSVEEGDPVLALMNTLIETLDEAQRPDVQVHAQTGVIIAKGSNEQLLAFADVVPTLQQVSQRRGRYGFGGDEFGQPMGQPKNDDDLAKRLENVQAEKRALEELLANAQAQITAQATALTELREQVDRLRSQLENTPDTAAE